MSIGNETWRNKGIQRSGAPWNIEHAATNPTLEMMVMRHVVQLVPRIFPRQIDDANDCLIVQELEIAINSGNSHPRRICLSQIKYFSR